MNSPTSNNKTFGERLIEALESREFTGIEQQEGKITRFFQVNVKTARKYLHAASCPDSLESKFQSLADALMMDATWLLTGQKPNYIGHAEAYRRLNARLGTTTPVTLEEIAAWLWMGAHRGGLDAYWNANSIDLPGRFQYTPSGNLEQDLDYVSPLMHCWYVEKDIDNFQPTNRYITGKALIERLSKRPGIKPEAYIVAKTHEDRLLGFHPILGGVRDSTASADYPPIEDGLFALSEIERIDITRADISPYRV